MIHPFRVDFTLGFDPGDVRNRGEATVVDQDLPARL
jgi:hypothetical protein